MHVIRSRKRIQARASSLPVQHLPALEKYKEASPLSSPVDELAQPSIDVDIIQALSWNSNPQDRYSHV